MSWYTFVATTSPDHVGEIKDAGNVAWLDYDRAWAYRHFDSHASNVAWFEDSALSSYVGVARGPHVDLNIIEGELEKKRLLIADMESTIIQQEMLDELADLIGKRAEVSQITERAMKGELDFEAAINERVALMAGLDAGVLDELAATRLSYMPGARELVATMKANGAYCALVSGGFTQFTAKVAAELGFDEHRANTLEIVDGKLTGRVVPPILGRDAKLAALRELIAKLGITPSQTISVGDGANDLAMLHEAGLGVAFHAKPAVRDAMDAHPTGAVISHCDLRALLYLQGYTSSQILQLS